MPANALAIQERKIDEFSAEKSSETVTISGKYIVRIQNQGFLPVPGVSVQVQSLKPTGSGEVFIEEESKNVGTISSNSSTSVSFNFQVTGSESDLLDAAKSGCRDSSVDVAIQELVSGTILGITTETEETLNVVSSSCALGSGGAPAVPQPEPSPDPEPPEDPEPPDQGPQNVTVNIVGPTSVTENNSNTWDIEGNNLSEVSTVEVNLGDGTSKEAQPEDSGFTVEHTYSSSGQYTAMAIARDSEGSTINTGTLEVSVTSQSDEDTEEDTEEDTDSGTETDYSVQIDGPNAVEANNSRTWEATSEQANESDVIFEFDMGDGRTKSSPTGTALHGYSEVGNYTIAVTMYRQGSDGGVTTGEELASDTYDIDVNPSTTPGPFTTEIVNTQEDFPEEGDVRVEVRITNEGAAGDVEIQQIAPNGQSSTQSLDSGESITGTVRFNAEEHSSGTYELGYSTPDDESTIEWTVDSGLSEEQLETLRRWDFKNDGVIDDEEANFATQRSGKDRLTDDELTLVTTARDRDTEFDPVGVDTSTAIANEDSMAVYDLNEQAIRDADVDGNGMLSEQEGQDGIQGVSDEKFEAILYFSENNIPFPQTERAAESIRKFKDLVAEFDTDGDGRLNQTEVQGVPDALDAGEISNNEATGIVSISSNDMRFPSDMESDINLDTV